ncbi:MAG: spore maturation protein [Clostridiales bacterium]|jgi:spore maturation protein B|nr:spore maturation protein [Clostridiales bacterium]
MSVVIDFIIPGLVLLIILFGIAKKINCFDSFLSGSKEGLRTVIKILPSLIGLITAVGVFRESGAVDMLVNLLRPILTPLRVPPEVMPLALLRPVSGSASLAVLSDILKSYGADSVISRAASVMMGSSETIFYTIAVYLGGSGIKKAPKVLTAALVGHLANVLAACWICRVL